MLEIFGHHFSSYTWKVLIPLYENETPFSFCPIDENHPDNIERLQAASPQNKFPLLIEGQTVLFESTVIIEYLQLRHSGKAKFIPDESQAALQVRMLDRFFDNYVMNAAQVTVDNCMRAAKDRDPIAIEKANQTLARSYTWLNTWLLEKQAKEPHKEEQYKKAQQKTEHAFIWGDSFSLADCAAAPSLFYADWVLPIDPGLTALRAYRANLLAHPSVKRCVDDARPYRHFFPPGAPDRD